MLEELEKVEKEKNELQIQFKKEKNELKNHFKKEKDEIKIQLENEKTEKVKLMTKFNELNLKY